MERPRATGSATGVKTRTCLRCSIWEPVHRRAGWRRHWTLRETSTTTHASGDAAIVITQAERQHQPSMATPSVRWQRPRRTGSATGVRARTCLRCSIWEPVHRRARRRRALGVSGTTDYQAASGSAASSSVRPLDVVAAKCLAVYGAANRASPARSTGIKTTTRSPRPTAPVHGHERRSAAIHRANASDGGSGKLADYTITSTTAHDRRKARDRDGANASRSTARTIRLP